MRWPLSMIDSAGAIQAIPSTTPSEEEILLSIQSVTHQLRSQFNRPNAGTEGELMHYKNGREAKNGDKVVLLPSYGPPVVGILYDAVAGNDYCNGKIAVTHQNDPCPNLKECLHLDDVLAALPAEVPDTTAA